MEWSDDDGAVGLADTIEPTEVAYVSDAVQPPKKIKRGRRKFIDARLVAALDSAKLSDEKAMHILVACALSLGHRVEELIMNRSSIHRVRQQMREEEVERIRSDFTSVI